MTGKTMKLGKFMKKRTKDLAIGGGLMVIGAGALAITIEQGQPTTATHNNTSAIASGEGYIQHANNNNSRQYVQEHDQINQQINRTPVNQGFNNLPNIPPTNTNTQATGPAANHQQANHQYNQPSQNNPLCAPEALAVGIKHFRYEDATDLVWSGYGTRNDPKYSIHPAAKEPLRELVNAAKRDGVTLTPGSIFRSAARQRQIVNNKRSQGQSPRQIYYSSSHPGFSEHHTGLAVDFTPINNSFANTPAYRWLRSHAAQYGWEQTFTADYSAYSGVSEESWHWRYVGKNGEFAHIFAASKNRAC